MSEEPSVRTNFVCRQCSRELSGTLESDGTIHLEPHRCAADDKEYDDNNESPECWNELSKLTSLARAASERLVDVQSALDTDTPTKTTAEAETPPQTNTSTPPASSTKRPRDPVKTGYTAQQLDDFEHEFDFGSLFTHEAKATFTPAAVRNADRVFVGSGESAEEKEEVELPLMYDESASFRQAWEFCMNDPATKGTTRNAEHMTLVVFRYHMQRSPDTRAYSQVRETCTGCHAHSHEEFNSFVACAYQYFINTVKTGQYRIFKSIVDNADRTGGIPKELEDMFDKNAQSAEKQHLCKCCEEDASSTATDQNDQCTHEKEENYRAEIESMRSYITEVQQYQQLFSLLLKSINSDNRLEAIRTILEDGDYDEVPAAANEHNDDSAKKQWRKELIENVVQLVQVRRMADKANRESETPQSSIDLNIRTMSLIHNLLNLVKTIVKDRFEERRRRDQQNGEATAPSAVATATIRPWGEEERLQKFTFLGTRLQAIDYSPSRMPPPESLCPCLLFNERDSGITWQHLLGMSVDEQLDEAAKSGVHVSISDSFRASLQNTQERFAEFAKTECIHRRMLSTDRIDDETCLFYYHIRYCRTCSTFANRKRATAYTPPLVRKVINDAAEAADHEDEDQCGGGGGHEDEQSAACECAEKCTRAHRPTVAGAFHSSAMYENPISIYDERCEQRLHDSADITRSTSSGTGGSNNKKKSDANQRTKSRYISMDRVSYRPFSVIDATDSKCSSNVLTSTILEGANAANKTNGHKKKKTDTKRCVHPLDTTKMINEPHSESTRNSSMCLPEELVRLFRFNPLHIEDKCCSVPFYVHKSCSLLFVMSAYWYIFKKLHPTRGLFASLYDTHAWVRNKLDPVAYNRFPVSKINWSQTIGDFVEHSRGFTYSTNEAVISRALSVHRNTVYDTHRSFAFVSQGLVLDMNLVEPPELIMRSVIFIKDQEERAAAAAASSSSSSSSNKKSSKCARVPSNTLSKDEIDFLEQLRFAEPPNSTTSDDNDEESVDNSSASSSSPPPPMLTYDLTLISISESIGFEDDWEQVTFAEHDNEWSRVENDTSALDYKLVSDIYAKSQLLHTQFHEHLTMRKLLENQSNRDSVLWNLVNRSTFCLFTFMKRYLARNNNSQEALAELADTLFYVLVKNYQRPSSAIDAAQFHRDRLFFRMAIQSIVFDTVRWFRCYLAWVILKELFSEPIAPTKKRGTLAKKNKSKSKSKGSSTNRKTAAKAPLQNSPDNGNGGVDTPKNKDIGVAETAKKSNKAIDDAAKQSPPPSAPLSDASVADTREKKDTDQTNRYWILKDTQETDVPLVDASVAEIDEAEEDDAEDKSGSKKQQSRRRRQRQKHKEARQKAKKTKKTPSPTTRVASRPPETRSQLTKQATTTVTEVDNDVSEHAQSSVPVVPVIFEKDDVSLDLKPVAEKWRVNKTNVNGHIGFHPHSRSPLDQSIHNLTTALSPLLSSPDSPWTWHHTQQQQQQQQPISRSLDSLKTLTPPRNGQSLPSCDLTHFQRTLSPFSQEFRFNSPEPVVPINNGGGGGRQHCGQAVPSPPPGLGYNATK